MQLQLVALIFCSGVVSVLLGLLSQRFWDREQAYLTATVLWICLAVSGLGIAPATTTLQYKADHYDRLTFNQYYNGVETGIQSIPTQCHEDGACYYTYPCHYYIVHHPGYYTGSGNKKTYHPGYDETKHHDCPYGKQEVKWLIHSTIGDFVVANHRFPAPAQPWYPFTTIPPSVLDEAGVGVPPEIARAQRQIESGDPRPATDIQQYTNYILASDNVLVKVPDTQVAAYRKAGLLPALSTGLVGVDQADKALFVGFAPSDRPAWEDAMMRLNMEAGSLAPVTARFDIQLVAVNATRVPETSADAYKLALNAYWESPFFGKSALPKNMAVVVVGTNGQTVEWARGFTLIPTGNGVTWTDIQAFAPGTAFTPHTLIGDPKAHLSKNADGTVNAEVTPTHGELEAILINGPHHFVRQHMTDHHPGSVGYQFLEGDILPGFWDCVRMFLIAVLLALVFCNGLFYLTYKVKTAE